MLGALLRAAREARHGSQAELAHQAGVSAEAIARLARSLGLPPAALGAGPRGERARREHPAREVAE